MSYQAIDDTIAFEDINISSELLDNNSDIHQEAAEGDDNALIRMATLVLDSENGQSTEIAIQLYRLAAKIGNANAMVCATKLMQDAQNISDAGQWCWSYLTRLISMGYFKEDEVAIESLVDIAKQLLKYDPNSELIECNDLETVLAKVAKLKEEYAADIASYDYGMSEKMQQAIQVNDSGAGQKLDRKVRASVNQYIEMLTGSASAAFELATSYANGETADGVVDLKTATKLYAIAADKGYTEAMPAHINRLKAEFNYAEANRIAPLYLSQMVSNERVGRVSRSSASDLVKVVITLLKNSNIRIVTPCIDVAATIKLIEKAHEEKLIDEKTLSDALDIEAELKVNNNKHLIIVAKDKFIESGDFKIGEYKSLWRASKLVDAPLSVSLEILDRQFPWMASVTKNIMKQIKSREFGSNQVFKIRPILLVGPPGSGKTSYCRALSEIIGVPFRTFMAGGSDSAIAMRGVARGYSTASPGFMPRFIAQEGVANGLMLVDELDKTSTGRHNGSLLDVMLQMLEYATSSIYYDEALEVRLDLSHLNWVATANNLSAIPKPLLSRFEIILVGEPDATGYRQAINKTRVDYAKELGLDARMLPELEEEDLDWLIKNCKSLREIARVTKSILEDRICSGSPMIH